MRNFNHFDALKLNAELIKLSSKLLVAIFLVPLNFHHFDNHLENGKSDICGALMPTKTNFILKSAQLSSHYIPIPCNSIRSATCLSKFYTKVRSYYTYEFTIALHMISIHPLCAYHHISICYRVLYGTIILKTYTLSKFIHTLFFAFHAYMTTT